MPSASLSHHSRLEIFVGLGLTLLALVILTAYEVTHTTGYSFGQAVYTVSDFDEGVYLATGALMAHGFALYSQIYNAQPPVFPLALSLGDRLFGNVIVTGRLTLLFFAFVAVLACAAIALQVRGWIAAGLAAILLVLSPEFLVYSHAIEEEVPMMALGAVSLACALWWWKTQRLLPAAAAGVFFCLAVLTKFFAFSLLLPVLVMVALTIWDNRHAQDGIPITRILRAGAGFVVGAVVPVGLSFAIWGQNEWNQMVGDRITATSGPAALQQESHLHLLRDLASTDPGLTVLAVIGGILLLVADWRMGLVIGSWMLATLVILMRYHPLFGHHLVILLAPTAVLAGICVSFAIPNRSGSGQTRLETAEDRGSAQPSTGPSRLRGRGMEITALAGVSLYIALIVHLVYSYPDLLVTQSTGDHTLASAGALVAKHTTAGAFVVTGDPWICVYANRNCVPGLVDTSDVRIETRKLSSQQAIAYTVNANPAAIALARGLCLLPKYPHWVQSNDRYQLLRRYPFDDHQHCATGIYLRKAS